MNRSTIFDNHRWRKKIYLNTLLFQHWKLENGHKFLGNNNCPSKLLLYLKEKHIIVLYQCWLNSIRLPICSFHKIELAVYMLWIACLTVPGIGKVPFQLAHFASIDGRSQWSHEVVAGVFSSTQVNFTFVLVTLLTYNLAN